MEQLARGAPERARGAAGGARRERDAEFGVEKGGGGRQFGVQQRPEAGPEREKNLPTNATISSEFETFEPARGVGGREGVSVQ